VQLKIEAGIMKKALILGTLSPQADAVRYLKSTDWWVIGCGHRKSGRALEILDQFELVDITNFDAVEKLARREQINLIYSVGSEVAMPAIAKVAPHLGLINFIPYETAELLHNKLLLRSFLLAYQISPVKFCKVTRPADLTIWHTFPVMVKPVDSQGQRGVFCARSMAEILAGLDRSLSHSPTHTVIVEEFLDGPEISANTFVVDGQIMFCAISDRLVVEGYPGGIPQGHIFPSRACTGDNLLATTTLVENCIHALNIKNGPVYFQMKLTATGPRIIEVMPRLDGCHLWRLIKTACGVDLIEACFRLLQGDKNLSFKPNSNENSYRLMFWHCSEQEFKQKDYPVPSGAIYHEYRYLDGEMIHPANGYLDVVGYYIDTIRNGA
jgi:phosphoribosylamine-glycine ligase